MDRGLHPSHCPALAPPTSPTPKPAPPGLHHVDQGTNWLEELGNPNHPPAVHHLPTSQGLPAGPGAMAGQVGGSEVGVGQRSPIPCHSIPPIRVEHLSGSHPERSQMGRASQTSPDRTGWFGLWWRRRSGLGSSDQPGKLGPKGRDR